MTKPFFIFRSLKSRPSVSTAARSSSWLLLRRQRAVGGRNRTRPRAVLFVARDRWSHKQYVCVLLKECFKLFKISPHTATHMASEMTFSQLEDTGCCCCRRFGDSNSRATHISICRPVLKMSETQASVETLPVANQRSRIKRNVVQLRPPAIIPANCSTFQSIIARYLDDGPPSRGWEGGLSATKLFDWSNHNSMDLVM